MTSWRRALHSAAFTLLCLLTTPASLLAEPAAVSAAPLLARAAEAGRELPRLRSLLVRRRGALVLERYYHRARPHQLANVKSVAKSVLSALVGIAIDRGYLRGVDQPVGPFFSEWLRGADRAAKAAITIEHLLTMQSGLESTSNRGYGPWVRSQHWVRYVLARPLVAPPGSVMEYSTGNTHLLSAILTKATGESTWAFAQRVLAEPLGFRLARWPRDPQGIYFGGNDMLLTPRQMLAFGELYLNRGRVGSRQVVPAGWVDASFVPRAQSRRWGDRFYGYGWWITALAGRPVYYAWGFGGQYIVLVPSLELVVVTTSSTALGDDRRAHRLTVLDIIERHVLDPLATLVTSSSPARSGP